MKQLTLRILLFSPFILLLGLSLLLWRGLSIDPTELPSAKLSQPFPAFQLTTVAKPNRYVSERDVTISGQPILVNVWGTWCPGCKLEHQQLLKLAKAGVPIIGVNYKDQRAAAQQWLATLGNPYQLNIYDPQGKLGLDLGVYGAPETFVIDSAGRIRYRHAGPIDEQVWQQLLRPLLDAQ